MGRVPRGKPLPEDEQHSEAASGDKTIISNTRTPAIEGYFRVPSIWVGREPDPESVRNLNLQIHHEVVLDTDLDSGIAVRVQLDGTFLFDFSSWDFAPQVVVPGYRHPGPGIPHRLPPETAEALQSAEDYAIVRAKVMNVQQACLATSEQILKGRLEHMGFPVDAQTTLKGQSFESAVSYIESALDVHYLARNAANNNYTVSPYRLFPRRVLELDVVKHSLAFLDRILLQNDLTLIHMIDSLYGAARRYSERRSGEAVVVAWAVCEQLLSSAWNGLLDDAKSDFRMSGKRRKKLKGRDYTASVMVEMLELVNRIDYDSYSRLEVARKSRNEWAHSFQEPNYSEVCETFGGALDLLHKFKGVRVLLTLTDPGPGVPSWYNRRS